MRPTQPGLHFDPWEDITAEGVVGKHDSFDGGTIDGRLPDVEVCHR